MKKSLLILGIFLAFFACFTEVWASQVEPAAMAINEEKTEQIQDLTVPKARVERMIGILDGRFGSGLIENSPVRQAIKNAVSRGVSVNTVVLLLIFPLVASLVAFSRQVVGLSGFGMITPSLLAIAFLSTGGLVGTLMLIFVVGSAILFKAMIKKLRVPYLPKLAILLWLVLLAVLVLMLSGGDGFWSSLQSIGIFPIILFVSVAETFIEAQITRRFSASVTMLLETVILAMFGYKLMSSHMFQSIALLNPELWLLFVLAVNMLIARYKGLRVLEVWRFRKIILR